MFDRIDYRILTEKRKLILPVGEATVTVEVGEMSSILLPEKRSGERPGQSASHGASKYFPAGSLENVRLLDYKVRC
jgi:hypothetical protein